MTLFRATADIGALFVVGEQPALLWVFRRKWNADFGGSGTSIPGSGTSIPDEVERPVPGS